MLLRCWLARGRSQSNVVTNRNDFHERHLDPIARGWRRPGTDFWRYRLEEHERVMIRAFVVTLDDAVAITGLCNRHLCFHGNIGTRELRRPAIHNFSIEQLPRKTAKIVCYAW